MKDLFVVGKSLRQCLAHPSVIRHSMPAAYSFKKYQVDVLSIVVASGSYDETVRLWDAATEQHSRHSRATLMGSYL